MAVVARSLRLYCDTVAQGIEHTTPSWLRKTVNAVLGRGMRRIKAKALRLLTQYVHVGGLAGTAVFLSQGEFAKALWCSFISALSILMLTLAILLAESLDR